MAAPWLYKSTRQRQEESLRDLALRISQADPQLQKQTSGNFGTTLLRGLSELVSLPFNAAAQTVDAFIPGEQIAWGEGLGELVRDTDMPQWLKRGIGFTGDTLIDPLTYVSFGAGPLLKKGAKEAAAAALSRSALKRAAGTGDDLAADLLGRSAKTGLSTKDILAHPAAAEGYKRVADAGPSYAKFLRDLPEDMYADLPQIAKGGVQFGVGKNKVSLISGKTTSKLTAPFSEWWYKQKPVEAVRKALVPGAQGEKAGLAGYLFSRELPRVTRRAAELGDEVATLLSDTERVVGRQTEEGSKERLLDLLYRPDRAGPLSPDEQDLIARWDDLFRRHYEMANEAGLNVEHLPGYRPRRLTDEAKAAKFGERRPGSPYRPAARPGFAQRRADDMFDAPFDEAQERFSRELEVEKAFEDDPFKVLGSWGRESAETIAYHELLDDLVRSGSLAPGLKQLGGVYEAEFRRAGFKGTTPSAVFKQARRAAMAGGTDPRLRKLSRRARALLEEEGQRANARSLGAALEATTKHEASVRQLGRRQMWADRAELRLSEKTTRAQDLGERISRLMEGDTSLLPKRTRAKLAKLDATIDAKVAERPMLVQGGLSSARVKELDKEVRTLLREKESLERKALRAAQEATQKQFAVARRSVLDAEEGLTSRQVKYADQADRVGEREEVLSNLEQGLNWSGEEWPAPKFREGARLPQGWARISGTFVGALEGLPAPQALADEVASQLWKGNEGAFLQTFDRLTALFKTWATLPRPGFHARNNIGAFFNNFLGGTGVKHYNGAFRLLYGQGPADEVLFDGVTRGELSEAMDLENFLKDPQTPLSEFMDPNKGTRPGKFVRRVGGAALQHTEAVHRTAAFLRGLELTGDRQAARQFMLVRHGNYSEMTRFERQVMKRLMPFYKWMRTNVPFQVQNLLQNPGRARTGQRFYENVLGDPEAKERLQEEGRFPLHQFLSGGIVAGGDPASPRIMNLDLPLYELQRFLPFNPSANLRQLASQTNPVLSTFLTLMTEKDLFRNEPLAQTRPATGAVLWPLAQAMERIPLLSDWVARSATGDLRINSKFAEFLDLVPSQNVTFAVDNFFKGDTSADSFISSLTGVRVSTLTPQAQEGETNRQERVLSELIRELYRRGYGDQFSNRDEQEQPRGIFSSQSL